MDDNMSNTCPNCMNRLKQSKEGDYWYCPKCDVQVNYDELDLLY